MTTPPTEPEPLSARVELLRGAVADRDPAHAQVFADALVYEATYGHPPPPMADVTEAILPTPVVSVADVLTLPAPVAVIWRARPASDDTPLCSEGEPLILSAPGSSGKSYLALHLALAAARGCGAEGAACGLTVRPGPVLVVSFEDGLARIAARVRALRARRDVPAADLARVALVRNPEPLWRPPDTRTGGAEPTEAWAPLCACVKILKPTLIIIDPIAAAGAGVNLNEGGAARACMRDLARLSSETGTGVLVIAHDTKASRTAARAGDDPGAGAVAGSGQWFDAARGVLYLARDEQCARKLQCLKANNGFADWSVPLAAVLGGDGDFHGFREKDTDADDPHAIQD